jgi:hypothetical protein
MPLIPPLQVRLPVTLHQETTEENCDNILFPVAPWFAVKLPQKPKYGRARDCPAREDPFLHGCTKLSMLYDIPPFRIDFVKKTTNEQKILAKMILVNSKAIYLCTEIWDKVKSKIKLNH